MISGRVVKTLKECDKFEGYHNPTYFCHTTEMSSLVSTVLLEFGSVFLRGGLAGESGPRFIVSAPRENSSRLSLFEFLSAIFNKYLPVKTKECRVLIIEKIFSHTRFRNDLLTVLLKDMQVLEVSIQPDLVLPSLTICNTPESTIPSAVVVDIGETQSRSIAIAYGRPLLDTLKGKGRIHTYIYACIYTYTYIYHTYETML